MLSHPDKIHWKKSKAHVCLWLGLCYCNGFVYTVSTTQFFSVRRIERDINKFYIGLLVNCQLLLLDSMELEFSRQIFEKSSSIKCHVDSSSGSPVVGSQQTDGRMDMTKLIAAFLDFVNAPKNVN